MKLVYPNFVKGRILKLEMLENLRDYSRDTLEVLTSDLSDGIVKGLEPSVSKDIITFSKGIVKHKGSVYLINDKLTISYEATDVDVLIKLVFLEESLEADYKIQYVSVVLDKNVVIKENEIELGRFKLKNGAYLRTEYKDLDDYTTEYNTINLINTKYANKDEHTLTPKFINTLGIEILKTKSKDIWDLTFATHCINSKTVARSLILAYINAKLNEDNYELTNDELHKKLIQIIKQVRDENRNEKVVNKNRKTILVD